MKDVKDKTEHIQDAVAYRIRAELVCCKIYSEVHRDALKIDRARETVDRMDHPDEPTSFGLQGAIGNAIVRGDWHEMCYWAEAAAQLAEGACPGYETIPNICRCTCKGCAHNCTAHQGATCTSSV